MNLDFSDAEFKKLSASLDTVFPEILDVFFQETESSLEEMDDKISDHKINEIHDIAHKIKSSTKTFGAFGLVKLLENIESLKTDDYEQFLSLQKQLNSEYKLVKDHILNNLQ